MHMHMEKAMRVPLNEEVVEGEDTTEPEFIQVTAEGDASYLPLDFDVVERYTDPIPPTEGTEGVEPWYVGGKYAS